MFSDFFTPLWPRKFDVTLAGGRRIQIDRSLEAVSTGASRIWVFAPRGRAPEDVAYLAIPTISDPRQEQNAVAFLKTHKDAPPSSSTCVAYPPCETRQMRILVFRHVPFESGGRLHDVIEPRGVSLEYVDLFRDGAAEPDVSAAAGLIFLGGPMSANDDLPYLRRELEIIRRAVEEDRPVLGICLGAQLVARAAGARVYRNPRKEIGWFDVRLTEAGLADPLFAGVSASETVFHWHGETFDLPRGAAWLAYSEHCRHQAFRIGRAVYGLQYHLEVTPAMIEQWCREDANCGDVRDLDAPLDPRRNEKRLAELSEIVFGCWTNLLQLM